MALITFASFSNATSGSLVLPVDAGLSSRCLRNVFVQTDSSSAALRMNVSIPRVRANGGVSFTLVVNQEATSVNGFIKELTRDTYFVNAGVLATLTMSAGSAITGTFGCAFDEVPKTGGMTGT